METIQNDVAAIDARFVAVIMKGLIARGIEPDTVLRRAGLDPDALRRSGARLSQTELARLVKTMTRLTGDEFWGILSRPIRPGTFRMLCRILIRSRDLQSAIVDGCRFYHLIVDDIVLRFNANDKTAKIWIEDRTRFGPDASVHGPVLFFVFGLMCWLVGRKLPLIAVRHAFPMGPHSASLRSYYQTTQTFGFARSEIEFDKSLLTHPIMPDEQRLSRFLASVPAALLVRFRENATFSERVRALLQRDLSRDMSFEEAADILMVKPQTLHRRLVEERTEGFRGIKDRLRSATAIDLLTQTNRSLEEIALSLGFSEVSTFHRAFRRWTGRTPGAVRQEHAR